MNVDILKSLLKIKRFNSKDDMKKYIVLPTLELY